MTANTLQKVTKPPEHKTSHLILLRLLSPNEYCDTIKFRLNLDPLSNVFCTLTGGGEDKGAPLIVLSSREHKAPIGKSK
eukprot:6486444-Amphidinium_carterae.1